MLLARVFDKQPPDALSSSGVFNENSSCTDQLLIRGEKNKKLEKTTMTPVPCANAPVAAAMPPTAPPEPGEPPVPTAEQAMHYATKLTPESHFNAQALLDWGSGDTLAYGFA